MKYLVFDIETRIDKSLVHAVYHPDEKISDSEAYDLVRQQLRTDHGNDFFPVSFHVPICITFGHVEGDLALTSLETLALPEVSDLQMAKEFWARVEPFDGALVTFNGRGFDLPVMELQALRHGVEAPRYFNERYGPRARFSDKHYDLHEFISNFGAYRVRGGLDLLSKLVGLPGKTSVRGGAVQQLWEAGKTAEIRRYCRRDVIQTYLLFLRVERMRGRITPARLGRLWAAAEMFEAELSE